MVEFRRATKSSDWQSVELNLFKNDKGKAAGTCFAPTISSTDGKVDRPRGAPAPEMTAVLALNRARAIAEQHACRIEVNDPDDLWDARWGRLL